MWPCQARGCLAHCAMPAVWAPTSRLGCTGGRVTSIPGLLCSQPCGQPEPAARAGCYAHLACEICAPRRRVLGAPAATSGLRARKSCGRTFADWPKCAALCDPRVRLPNSSCVGPAPCDLRNACARGPLIAPPALIGGLCAWLTAHPDSLGAMWDPGCWRDPCGEPPNGLRGVTVANAGCFSTPPGLPAS